MLTGITMYGSFSPLITSFSRSVTPPPTPESSTLIIHFLTPGNRLIYSLQHAITLPTVSIVSFLLNFLNSNTLALTLGVITVLSSPNLATPTPICSVFAASISACLIRLSLEHASSTVSRDMKESRAPLGNWPSILTRHTSESFPYLDSSIAMLSLDVRFESLLLTV